MKDEEYLYLDVRFKHQNDKTTVAIVSWRGTQPLTGIGVAKLQPGDHYNQQIGEQIALGRALMDLGLKEQNRWILRSRTEAEVQTQRSKKNEINVKANVDTSDLSNTVLLEYFDALKDVTTVGRNRPKQKKAK